MLDPQALLRDFAAVSHKLARRGITPQAIAALAAQAEGRRAAIHALEALRQRQNQANEQMQRHLRDGDGDALQRARERLRADKAAIKAAEADCEAAQEGLQQALLSVPNLPEDAVPSGASEDDNVEMARVGQPRSFSFAPKPHWEVAEGLGIADFARAAKMSGPRFTALLGAGAALERALANFMLDRAIANGYCEVSPPLLVRPHSMQTAGQYPKFVGEAFATQDGELVLIPTSEVSLVNLHRDEILPPEALPRRYTAWTPCFRREAGAAGRDTRGLIRQHQFHKVELVTLCAPDDSGAEHERILRNATGVLDALELPYRVVDLCSGDLGFAAQRTFDVEVWLPAQQTYREISSCSNCGDFQARRGAIRHRATGSRKPQLVHTLNGSSLAVGRTLVAILENFQQADGSVSIPAVLRPYLGGLTHIAPAASVAPPA